MPTKSEDKTKPNMALMQKLWSVFLYENENKACRIPDGYVEAVPGQAGPSSSDAPAHRAAWPPLTSLSRARGIMEKTPVPPPGWQRISGHLYCSGKTKDEALQKCAEVNEKLNATKEASGPILRSTCQERRGPFPYSLRCPAKYAGVKRACVRETSGGHGPKVACLVPLQLPALPNTTDDEASPGTSKCGPATTSTKSRRPEKDEQKASCSIDLQKAFRPLKSPEEKSTTFLCEGVKVPMTLVEWQVFHIKCVADMKNIIHQEVQQVMDKLTERHSCACVIEQQMKELVKSFAVKFPIDSVPSMRKFFESLLEKESKRNVKKFVSFRVAQFQTKLVTASGKEILKVMLKHWVLPVFFTPNLYSQTSTGEMQGMDGGVIFFKILHKSILNSFKCFITRAALLSMSDHIIRKTGDNFSRVNVTAKKQNLCPKRITHRRSNNLCRISELPDSQSDSHEDSQENSQDDSDSNSSVQNQADSSSAEEEVEYEKSSTENTEKENDDAVNDACIDSSLNSSQETVIEVNCDQEDSEFSEDDDEVTESNDQLTEEP